VLPIPLSLYSLKIKYFSGFQFDDGKNWIRFQVVSIEWMSYVVCLYLLLCIQTYCKQYGKVSVFDSLGTPEKLVSRPNNIVFEKKFDNLFNPIHKYISILRRGAHRNRYYFFASRHFVYSHCVRLFHGSFHLEPIKLFFIIFSFVCSHIVDNPSLHCQNSTNYCDGVHIITIVQIFKSHLLWNWKTYEKKFILI